MHISVTVYLTPNTDQVRNFSIVSVAFVPWYILLCCGANIQVFKGRKTRLFINNLCYFHASVSCLFLLEYTKPFTGSCDTKLGYQ